MMRLVIKLRKRPKVNQVFYKTKPTVPKDAFFVEDLYFIFKFGLNTLFKLSKTQRLKQLNKSKH